MTNHPLSMYRTAYELELEILNGRKLIIEANKWIISQQKELVRRLEKDSISKEELDGVMSEIRQTEQQIEALYEQIKASEKRVEKVLKKDENKG